MRLVVFDVDGTLVDSQAIIVAAQERAFRGVGLEPPGRERALSIVGLSLTEAFTVLVGPEGPVADLVDGYKTAFHELRTGQAIGEPLFPGAAETVTALAAESGTRLGIATGKSRRGVAHLLEREGWTAHFATVQTADDAPSKPDPGMLLQAMAETGIGPEATTMIGDSTFDIAMARNAGVRAIGVAWGYHKPEALMQTGAETVVPSYEALRRLLATSKPAGGAPI